MIFARRSDKVNTQLTWSQEPPSTLSDHTGGAVTRTGGVGAGPPGRAQSAAVGFSRVAGAVAVVGFLAAALASAASLCSFFRSFRASVYSLYLPWTSLGHVEISAACAASSFSKSCSSSIFLAAG